MEADPRRTLTGEATVISPSTPRSPEAFAIVSVVIGVLLAAILTLVPTVAFGTFRQMAAILVAADLTVYIAMKLGWLKMWRDR
jgi:hypothetical protein